MQTPIAPPLKSPLKWLGNKSRLPAAQKDLIREASKGRRWIDPFGGGFANLGQDSMGTGSVIY